MNMDIEFKDDNNEGNMINVNGCNDPYYRYKMEPLYVIHTEAKGGTTIIRNLHCVSEAIYRKPVDLKSYYSKHLGLTARIKNSELHMPGKFTKEALQQSLQQYINHNVLCPKCGSPETREQAKDYICQACGHILNI
jgi:translation initiation factor 2 beta subunit (eIF-2beta)/eIF-5